MAILAVLVGIIIVVLNPRAQLNKAKDAQKLRALAEMRNALEMYYNDNNVYPTSIPFGREWKEGDTIYMKKVPQDSNVNPPYRYQVNPRNPQWAVLYATLPNTPTASCALSSLCFSGNAPTPNPRTCGIIGGSTCQSICQTVPLCPGRLTACRGLSSCAAQCADPALPFMCNTMHGHLHCCTQAYNTCVTLGNVDCSYIYINPLE